MITMPIEIYSDGSCLGNPGAGGYSYVIRYWDLPEGADIPEDHILEGKQGYRLTTNNRMEIMGMINGIKLCIQNVQNGTFNGLRQINVFSDSEYVVQTINYKWIDNWANNGWMTSGKGNYKSHPVNNKDLWEEVLEVRKQLQSMGINFNISHVAGHNGNEYNEMADRLAVSASHDSTNHLIDEEYEKKNPYRNRR